MSFRTASAAPGYWKVTSSNASSPGPTSVVTGSSGGRTEDSVPSTSAIRSALTEARGIIITMKVAIITDIRICIR